MEIKEYKKIKEIDKKYFKVIGMKCDDCGREIKENELYLEVNYNKYRYDNTLNYKQFCKECIKENMYKMFMNNYYTNFSKYNFRKYDDWQECDFDD